MKNKGSCPDCKIEQKNKKNMLENFKKLGLDQDILMSKFWNAQESQCHRRKENETFLNDSIFYNVDNWKILFSRLKWPTEILAKQIHTKEHTQTLQAQLWNDRTPNEMGNRDKVDKSPYHRKVGN